MTKWIGLFTIKIPQTVRSWLPNLVPYDVQGQILCRFVQLVDSRQISPTDSLMLRILDLVSLARLTVVSRKVWDKGKHVLKLENNV